MLGVSSKIGGKFWLKTIPRMGFKLIELNHRFTTIRFSGKKIQGINEQRRNSNVRLTIHSRVTDLLHKDELINNYQLLMLKSEIKYAPVLGVKDIVFHLPKYLDPAWDGEKINSLLSELIGFAGEHGVQLYLENDPRGPWGHINNLLLLFKNFKSLKHNLDIGHLNVLINSGIVKSEKEYFNKLGGYINYVHLHGNNGLTDEHKALGSGNVKMDTVIPLIKKVNPEFMIIETINARKALKTKELLKSYGIT